MKVFVLTLTTLCIAAVTQANWDYQLQCKRQEIGIRWPSYYSNSDYYICQREGGRQLKNTCPDGQLFSFALQSCTTPNRFIPPPPMNILPTASPLVEKPSLSSDFNQNWLPKPIHVQYPDDSNNPTVHGNEYVRPIEEAIQYQPSAINEGLQTVNKPITPPSINRPIVSELEEESELPFEVSQSSTPAPTSPIVEPPQKKTPPAPPSANQKQSASKKQVPTPASKKNQSVADTKKTPPKPVSKSQKAKVQPPKPVSKTQQ